VRRGLLALVLLLALASGCGHGGEKRLSKEEFAQRADAVCRRTNRLTQPASTPTTMPALARLAERSLPPLDRARRDLRRLLPPEDEQATVRAWLRQLVLLRADAVRIRDRARANDAKGVRTVALAAQRVNDRFHSLAARLGMRVCSRD
jgi:hypothetical protein